MPDPQDPETFERSKLDWSEPTRPDHARVLGFYRSLIALRRTEPALHDPAFASVDAEFDEAAGWFAMHRGEWSVVCIPRRGAGGTPPGRSTSGWPGSNRPTGSHPGTT